MKIRTSGFDTYTRSASLKESTDLTEEIWQLVLGLFERRVRDSWLPVRLLGVGATGLKRATVVQANLFDQNWRHQQRELDQAVDAIRQQFGDKAIRRGVWMDRTFETEH